MVNYHIFKIMWVLVFLSFSLTFFWLGGKVDTSVSIDIFTYNIVDTWNQPTLYLTMRFITEAGAVWWFVVTSLIIGGILWWLKQGQWILLLFFLTISGGGILNVVLKDLFERERPANLLQYDGHGYSFPSGHAMGSLVFYGFIIYLLVKSNLLYRYKVILCSLLIGLIFLIGLSRVYLGVHYITDVIAGFMAGLVWLMVCIGTFEWMKKLKPEFKKGAGRV